MKKISLLLLLIITACDSSDTESIEIGSKETEYLNIENFPHGLKAKNIILAVGDGNGFNQTMLSRIAIGGLDYRLAIDQIPNLGVSSTHSYDNVYTDSAASATAWSTGHKTKNRYLALDIDKQELKTITEMLHKKGYQNALVATSSVVHATPAALYAHIDSRYKYDEIADQLVNSSIDIALGGGLKFFDIESVKNTHYVLLDKASLNDTYDNQKKIIGLFDDDGIERGSNQPTQREMTDFALKHLSKDKCNGFFLMTEASQIDWAAHDNNANEMITEFRDFDLTIKDLINFVTKNKETLLIVTADHETGGLQILKQKEGSVTIQWGTGSHTSIPVGVFAYGPGSELFNGMMDNTDLHYKMLDALDFKNLNNEVCDL